MMWTSNLKDSDLYEWAWKTYEVNVNWESQVGSPSGDYVMNDLEAKIKQCENDIKSLEENKKKLEASLKEKSVIKCGDVLRLDQYLYLVAQLRDGTYALVYLNNPPVSGLAHTKPVTIGELQKMYSFMENLGEIKYEV